MAYRMLSEPEPEGPDPAVVAYTTRAEAQRRRAFRRVVGLGILLVLTAGILLALPAIRERRMRAEWREVLTCFDDGSVGFQARVRARQLASIGGVSDSRSAWPSRCSAPLRTFAVAADDANHRVLASSANNLAVVAARADLENEDLVGPASTLIDDARRVDLTPTDSAHVTVSQPAVPLLSSLSALPSVQHPAGWLSCIFAEDGRSVACAVDPSWSQTSVRLPSGHTVGLAGRALDEVTGDRNDCGHALSVATLEDGDLGVYTCDKDTFYTERAGVGPRPPSEFLAVARLGTKLVVVWAPRGEVGGVRMRFAEKHALALARTRVILDDQGSAVADLRLFGGNDRALLLLTTVAGDVFALRLDANGEVSPVTASQYPKFPR